MGRGPGIGPMPRVATESPSARAVIRSAPERPNPPVSKALTVPDEWRRFVLNSSAWTWSAGRGQQHAQRLALPTASGPGWLARWPGPHRAQMARACPSCVSVDRQALCAADVDAASTSALKKTTGAALQLPIPRVPSSGSSRPCRRAARDLRGRGHVVPRWLAWPALCGGMREWWPGGARCELGASELHLAGTALAVSPSVVGGRPVLDLARIADVVRHRFDVECVPGRAGSHAAPHRLERAGPSRRAAERDEQKIAAGRTHSGLHQASAGVPAGRRAHRPCRLGEAGSDRENGPLHGTSQGSWTRRQRNRNRLPGAGGGGAGREGAAGDVRQVVYSRSCTALETAPCCHTRVLFGPKCPTRTAGRQSTGWRADPRPRRRRASI